MEKILEDEKFRDQVSATVVDTLNLRRITEELRQLDIQDDNFRRAVQQIDIIRESIGTPQNILGNENTKHGEIAEFVEVGIRRARQALNGEKMTATFDGVGRNAPADYIIDGLEVQAKYINGTNNNLNAVLHHMDKYPNFGRDGSYYHIPKDEFELIEKIRNNGSIEGLKLRTIELIKDKIEQIEKESGKSFENVVKPGISEYSEVQQGKIHQTLDKHDEQISKDNIKKKEQISQEHQPNLGEAIKATGIATAVGAAVSMTTSLYKKYKEGKKFYKGDFSEEDWKEVGIDTVKGGAIGGVSGAAIYGLTNYASLSAPFAGAIVSASKGVGSLVKDLNSGNINHEEFVELGMVICAESAIVGFATVIGQTAIPVPILGAVLGSIAGTILANALGSGNKVTAKMIRDDMEEYLQTIDEKYRTLINGINEEFEKLGDLTQAAFSIKNNISLLKLSIDLARMYGVDESQILKSLSDIDDYMAKQ